jgi:hypothetical protein
MGYTVKEIAEKGLLGGVLHPNTLYSRLRSNNMQIRSSYTDISDDDLHSIVAENNRDHPNSGKFKHRFKV